MDVDAIWASRHSLACRTDLYRPHGDVLGQITYHALCLDSLRQGEVPFEDHQDIWPCYCLEKQGAESFSDLAINVRISVFGHPGESNRVSFRANPSGRCRPKSYWIIASLITISPRNISSLSGPNGTIPAMPTTRPSLIFGKLMRQLLATAAALTFLCLAYLLVRRSWMWIYAILKLPLAILLVDTLSSSIMPICISM